MAVIYWNFSKFLWVSERLSLQLTWYGLFFVSGICLAYFAGARLVLSLYNTKNPSSFSKKEVQRALENFVLYSLFFIIVGARLAYVVFYGWHFYVQNPQEILKIWHGGLSSHGAIIGLLLWVAIFSWTYRKRIFWLTYLFLTDLCGAVFGCSAFLIRLGNFMNQEIIGTPTSLPWGVVFSNPVQGIRGIPVHPVQLYEAIGYLVLSLFLYILAYKRFLKLGRGWITAVVCLGVALIRFFAEFVKTHQGKVVNECSLLSIGQILSLPLFFFGVGLLGVCFMNYKKRQKRFNSK
ncbi:prolipoprotein diacylglyceryl transferase [Chlamydia sp. 17-3921]|uniref:prolipoprotein diacylglyceryl transferase n=1 Tax=Chlamydia sp. 17-3921 TaxID=2675798 RepID=UPI001919A21B|nr:prolipoprotein diacylglyceryl transferase [Chlamydia sp. 17-3921]